MSPVPTRHSLRAAIAAAAAAAAASWTCDNHRLALLYEVRRVSELARVQDSTSGWLAALFVPVAYRTSSSRMPTGIVHHSLRSAMTTVRLNFVLFHPAVVNTNCNTSFVFTVKVKVNFTL